MLTHPKSRTTPSSLDGNDRSNFAMKFTPQAPRYEHNRPSDLGLGKQRNPRVRRFNALLNALWDTVSFISYYLYLCQFKSIHKSGNKESSTMIIKNQKLNVLLNLQIQAEFGRKVFDVIFDAAAQMKKTIFSLL